MNILLPDLSKVAKRSAEGVPMAMPLALGLKADGSDLWTLPIEPQISVQAMNEIVMRKIAKRSGYGTVKEYWAQGDYSFSVRGMFMGSGVYPEADVTRLDRLCKAKQALLISCPVATLLGVEQVVVLRWGFPHTPGETMQSYEIEFASDQNFNLK